MKTNHSLKKSKTLLTNSEKVCALFNYFLFTLDKSTATKITEIIEGGRSVHELQKIVRRLEVEKEEIQHALDEAEAALEAEESKVLRAQVEVAQIRSEIEKRIQEKEEEFENTRKNHQRALESMQATLEAETRGKQEALRIKKKLESDINVN